MDIMLPKLDGFEILEKLGRDETPIIFLSAKNDVSTIVRGLKKGIDYMTKPFEPLEEVKNTFQNSKGTIYFDKEHITKLLEEHRAKTKDNYKKIWTIYIFLKWYDIYFAD